MCLLHDSCDNYASNRTSTPSIIFDKFVLTYENTFHFCFVNIRAMLHVHLKIDGMWNMIFEPKHMLRSRFSHLKTFRMKYAWNISTNCFLAWIEFFPKNSNKIKTSFFCEQELEFLQVVNNQFFGVIINNLTLLCQQL